MRGKSSASHNLIMTYMLQISNFVFPLLTYPYITRVLGADGLGKVSFANSVTNYFAALATFGITTYGVRTCAKVRDDVQKLTRTTHELMIANLITTLIAAVLLVIMVLTVPKFQEQWLLMLVFGVSVLTEFLGMNWFYTSLEQFGYITTRTVAFKLLSMILIFLLVRKKSDYIIYAAITVFAIVASNFVNFLHSRKYIEFKLEFPYEIRKHYHYTKWFFVQSVAMTLFFNMDVTMLGFLSTNSQVGNYEIALKIKYLLSALVSSLGMLFLPKLSNDYAEKNMDSYWHTVFKSLRYICFIAIPMVGFIWIESGDIIYLLCGAGYELAENILRGLVVVVLIIGLSTVTGTQILISMEKEKCVFISILSGSVVNFIMNIILIPSYDAMGATIVTIISEVVVLAVQLFFIGKQNVRLHILKIMRKPLFGAVLAFIGVITASQLIEGTAFIRLILLAGLYGIVYAGTLFIVKEEIFMELVKMVPRRGKSGR